MKRNAAPCPLAGRDLDKELAAIVATTTPALEPAPVAYEWLQPGVLLASPNFTLAVVSWTTFQAPSLWPRGAFLRLCVQVPSPLIP